MEFSGHMSSSGKTGFPGGSGFNFLRTVHADFHHGCVNLHPTAANKVPLSSYPLLHLLSDLLMTAFLPGVRWESQSSFNFHFPTGKGF